MSNIIMPIIDYNELLAERDRLRAGLEELEAWAALVPAPTAVQRMEKRVALGRARAALGWSS